MIVVDTNILAYRWLPGPRNAEADELVRRDSNWCAPLLWRSELRNVLAGYIRRQQLALNDACLVMHKSARCLLGGEHLVADDIVLDLAAQSMCSAYDCEFVALADSLDILLVTDDKALLHVFPKSCCSLADSVRRKPGR